MEWNHRFWDALRSCQPSVQTEAQQLRDGGLLVAAQQRLAFAAAFALHDGFLLAPREFTLAAVPTRVARPGTDGRPCHPHRAMMLDAAPLHLAGAYMPHLEIVRRARKQGWARHGGAGGIQLQREHEPRTEIAAAYMLAVFGASLPFKPFKPDAAILCAFLFLGLKGSPCSDTVRAQWWPAFV